MNILVLGGTQFVGHHIVTRLLSGGHTVSIFTRGQTPDDLPSEVERLHGDRNAGDLAALAGRTWDACVDVSGYLPRVVGQSAELLREAVGRYLFISTISVYPDEPTAPITEDSALAVLSDANSEDTTADYGALKVVCEERVRAIYGEHSTIVRPGLVAGPLDHTGRFTYWALRAARGGVALAPGDGQDYIQVIDARDLAAFVVHLLTEDISGTFNAVGKPYLFAPFLDEVARGVGAHPAWIWIPQADLKRLGAEQVWPVYTHRWLGLNIKPVRAKAAGLILRPLAETARDTLAWAEATGAAGKGPDAAREAELLGKL